MSLRAPPAPPGTGQVSAIPVQVPFRCLDRTGLTNICSSTVKNDLYHIPIKLRQKKAHKDSNNTDRALTPQSTVQVMMKRAPP